MAKGRQTTPSPVPRRPHPAPRTLELTSASGPLRVLAHVRPAPAGTPALGPSIGEYPVYDADCYRILAADVGRNTRFRAALRALAADRTALDIGTGGQLFWAREALDAGAAGVVAIEVMEPTYRQAATHLAQGGLANRIDLLHGLSTELTLDQPADVCVAEIIGSVAGAEGAAAVLGDARRRHLRPEGRTIPHRCTTQAAVVGLRAVLGGREVAFDPATLPFLERLTAWHGRPFDPRLRVRDPDPAAVVSTDAPVEVLDFNGDLRTGQKHTVTLTMTGPGQVDGVLTWLRIACLPEEEPLDALRDGTSWATVYFPLFDTELPVASGDTLDLSVSTSLGADGIHPDYHLRGTLRTAVGTVTGEHHSPHSGAPFRHHPHYRTLFPG